MKRFAIAAALAVALGLGTSGKADAQIVYGYSVPNAGGVSTGGTVMAPGGWGYKTFNNYYSPFTGTMMGQSYYTDVFGQSMTRSYAYNGFTGMGYRTGFYQPNYYAAPFGGYSYGNTFMRPRWGMWGW